METNELTNLNQVKDNENVEVSSKKYTFKEKMYLVATNITVEPIMFCFDIPHAVTSLAMQHLNLEKGCRVDLNFTGSICDAMAIHNETGFTKEDEAVVQKYVTGIMVYRNILQNFIPILLIMFIGSWSDRHQKRKVFIILPIIGRACVVIGLAIATYFFYEMSLVYNVFFEGFPPAITGGWHTFDMAIFAYISGITTLEERTVRVGAVNLILTVAGTVGAAVCGVLYFELGFYGCYAYAISAYTFGIAYTVIRLKDPKLDSDQKHKKAKKHFLLDFFDPSIVNDTFKVTFRSGDKNRRYRIFVIMILVVVLTGPLCGESEVFYMFVRYKYNWSEIDYSIYSTFNAVIHVAGGIIALWLFSRFAKVDDAMLGMLSSMSKIVSSLVFTFAPNQTFFCMGAVVEMFNGTSFIAMRTLISKLVPANELGKVYSVFSIAESVAPLLYGPMYNYIYRFTIDVMPGCFFLAGGALTIPSVLIFYWLHLENQRDIRREFANTGTTNLANAIKLEDSAKEENTL